MELNLNVTEIKAFVPAKDFALSKQFYQDMGFTLRSDGDGVAYLLIQNVSFLLQDFYNQELANNLMIHLLVENANDWYLALMKRGLVEKYAISMTEPEKRPWKMIDFTLTDPSGVLWRIGHNI